MTNAVSLHFGLPWLQYRKLAIFPTPFATRLTPVIFLTPDLGLGDALRRGGPPPQEASFCGTFR